MSTRLILIVVAVVALIGAGSFIGYKIGSPGGGPSGKVVSEGALVDKVLKISELATVAYHTATYQLVNYEGQKYNEASYKVFKFWQGRVKAGVNLDKSRVTVKSGEPAGAQGTVVIALPQAEILSAEPDKDGFAFHVAYTSLTGWGPGDDLKASWANEGVEKLKASARKGGIENDAATRAKEILTGFVEALGYKVSFVEANPKKP